MKLVVSSYNRNQNALSLINIDLNSCKYEILDNVNLTEPSFVTGYQNSLGENIIFTYDKEPLTLKAYKIIENKLKLIDFISVPLKTLTHLVFSKKNNCLFGASYADDSYLKVSFINKFFDLKVISQGGKCHCVTLDNNEEKLFITNIEKDKIFIYDINLNYLSEIDLKRGIGPRHTIIEDDCLLTITEYSNEIIIYKKINDCYKQINNVSTLNSDIKSNGATLMFSNDKNEIYASNRGEDSIAIFRNNLKNDLITYIKSIPCFGKHPRHMILSNDGMYIISCNKNSNNLVLISTNDYHLIIDIPYEKVSCAFEIIE